MGFRTLVNLYGLVLNLIALKLFSGFWDWFRVLGSKCRVEGIMGFGSHASLIPGPCLVES